MSRTQDIYEEPIIFQDDEKFKIRVYHPILTEEERAKRMKQIHDSAAALLKSQMRKEMLQRRNSRETVNA